MKPAAGRSRTEAELTSRAARRMFPQGRERAMKLFLFAMAVAVAATAAAREGPRRAATKSPDDMICREVAVSGSRLDVQRICMTRLQWDEQRRDARDAVERAQTQQVNPRG